MFFNIFLSKSSVKLTKCYAAKVTLSMSMPIVRRSRLERGIEVQILSSQFYRSLSENYRFSIIFITFAPDNNY